MAKNEMIKELKALHKEIEDLKGYTRLVDRGVVDVYQCCEWLVEREKVLNIINHHIKELEKHE